MLKFLKFICIDFYWNEFFRCKESNTNVLPGHDHSQSTFIPLSYCFTIYEMIPCVFSHHKIQSLRKLTKNTVISMICETVIFIHPSLPVNTMYRNISTQFTNVVNDYNLPKKRKTDLGQILHDPIFQGRIFMLFYFGFSRCTYIGVYIRNR
jgi:hypothetical protein